MTLSIRTHVKKRIKQLFDDVYSFRIRNVMQLKQLEDVIKLCHPPFSSHVELVEELCIGQVRERCSGQVTSLHYYFVYKWFEGFSDDETNCFFS